MFIPALWSPAGKWLTSRLLLVMFIVFVTFPCGILGQVWYLIVSFPDFCRLVYFTKQYCIEGLVYLYKGNQLLSNIGRFSIGWQFVRETTSVILNMLSIILSVAE